MDALPVVCGQFSHAFGSQDAVQEVAMALRDQSRQVVDGPLGFGVVGGRDDDVDTIGPAADMVVDPAQFGLQLLRTDGGRAQHAEAAGLGDLDDDVAAM